MEKTWKPVQFSGLNTNNSQLNWDNQGLINQSELLISATGGMKESNQTAESNMCIKIMGWVEREGNKQKTNGKTKVSYVPDLGDGGKFCLTRWVVWLFDLDS